MAVWGQAVGSCAGTAATFSSLLLPGWREAASILLPHPHGLLSQPGSCTAVPMVGSCACAAAREQRVGKSGDHSTISSFLAPVQFLAAQHECRQKQSFWLHRLDPVALCC